MRTSLLLPGALLLAFVVSPAAHASSARLLAEDDAVGSSSSSSGLALLPGDPLRRSAAKGPSYASVLGVAGLTGLATAPTGLFLASFVGGMGISLVGAALPALLVMGLFAPAVTTFAAWAYGNWRQEGRFGYLAAFGASTLAHVLVLVVSATLGLSVANPASVLLFSLVDGVVMGGATVGTLWLTREKPASVALPSFVPGVTPTAFVPFASVEL